MPSVEERHSMGSIGTPHRQLITSNLNDAQEKEWATLLATQTTSWHAVEGQQQIEYDQACAGNAGLTNEVALIRGHLHTLVLLDRQHEQEKETLRICQGQERADRYFIRQPK